MQILFGFYLLCSVALLPVAYIVGIFDKIASMKTQTSERERIMNNLLFIPFGPVILAFDILADMFYFWKNNFRPSEGLKVIIIAKEKSTISHPSIRDIMSICKKYHENKVKSANTKQFVQTFAKKLKVNQNLQFLLFGQMIPIGGFKDGNYGNGGRAYTYKTMKTQELRETRKEEIMALDDTQ